MADSLSPEQRSQRARIAAHEKHARYDPRESTQPARSKFLRKFDEQVPAEVTDPDERARRAEQFLKAHMARLALASSRARAARKASARKGAT